MEMQELLDHLELWKQAWPKLTRTALRTGASVVANEVKRRWSGSVLHEFSGELVRGVRYSTKLSPISAKVYVSPKQQYKAVVHEEGRTIVGKPWMQIKPAGVTRRAKGLYYGRPSTITIPARPVFSDSLNMKIGEVCAVIEKTIVDDIEGRT